MATTESKFDTTEYRFAHGRQPRGTGYWFFFRTVVAGEVVQQQEFSVSGTFTEAKAAARKVAAPAGFAPLGTGWTVGS